MTLAAPSPSTRANRPTPPRVAELIAKNIPFRSDHTDGPQEIKVLDPCCGSGTALERFAQAIGAGTFRITTYGVERNPERAQRAVKHLDHTLECDLFGTTIANNIFNIIFLNPPAQTKRGRTEHRFLTHCAKYLVHHGLLIYIIPRESLKTSVRHLAEHYGNIQCRQFPQGFQKDEEIIITANRKDYPSPEPEQMDQLLHWASGEEPRPATIEIPWRDATQLTTQPSRDILFTRRTFEPQDAIREAEAQGLWNRQDVRKCLWPDEPGEVKPLMPLRKGHLAMLIAAGFLNNMILEQDGQRIIVKGRTEKKQVRQNNRNGRNQMFEEVWQERMRISVTTLDLQTGEFNELRA